jgi:predicted Rossmann fold nucleotide-binding protein DprA/Smf involved in DNA uptake
MAAGAATADEVAQLSGLNAASAAAALTELELSGTIAVRDGVYRR